MKNFSLPLLILASVLVLHGCASVSVISDYDQDVDFNSYKTYAFYKTGIDRARISDLDKKRILRAIETEMSAKGFTKSEEPDLLVSIFTNERVEVDIYNGGWWLGIRLGMARILWILRSLCRTRILGTGILR